jgi:hypothetical protein
MTRESKIASDEESIDRHCLWSQKMTGRPFSVMNGTVRQRNWRQQLRDDSALILSFHREIRFWPVGLEDTVI